jgi:hypothetical protein
VDKDRENFGNERNLVKGEDGTFAVQFGLESAPKTPKKIEEELADNVIPFKPSIFSKEGDDDTWSDLGYNVGRRG